MVVKSRKLITMKHQITNNKFQTNPKLQIPMTKTFDSEVWNLEIGICDLFVIWDLLFGISFSNLRGHYDSV